MEVMTSSPVQECSLMEIDDGNGALNLTKSKRKRGKKAGKRPLNANPGLLEMTDADVSETVDKASSSKGKEHTKVASGTDVADNTAKRRKRKAMKNDNPDSGDILSTCERTKEGSSMTCGKTTTLDADMGSKERDDAEAGNVKTGESETTDLNVNDDGKGKKRQKAKNKRPTLGEILNTQCLQSLDGARGERGSGTILIGNSASGKEAVQKLNKNPDLGDVLSSRESIQEGSSTTKVLEVKSGETVLGKTATSDADMVSKGDHTEVVSGRMGEGETTDLNVNDDGKGKKRRKAKNKRPTLGEILNTQCLQSLDDAKGETGSGTILIGNSASEKEAVQKLNKNPDLGDVLSTRESIQEGSSTTKVLEVKSGETVLGKTATLDVDMVSKGETTDLNVNGKNKMKKKPRLKNKQPTLAADLNLQYLQNLEASKGEKGSGTTSTDNPTSKKQKKQKLNKDPDLGDILSTCGSTHVASSTTKVLDVNGGETVSAKAAAPDANVMSKGDNTEVANSKTGESEAINLNGKEKKKRKAKSKNKRPTLGDILSPQYLQNLEAAGGEMDSGTTSTGNSASQQRKREKTMSKNPDLGDILSTRESTQEGLITTKVFEAKSGETVLAKTAPIDANIVSNGDHAEVSVGKTGESETTNLNVNSKEKKKKKPKSKNKRPTLGEILNPQYLQNLEAAERALGTPTKVVKVKSREMVSGKTATSDANMVSKGDHTEVVKGQEKKKPKSKNKEKKLIILDVNGLLADVLVARPKGIVADKYLPRRAIFKRPYLDDFLRFCFERFEVGIWSSRIMKNLVPVIKFLFGKLSWKLLFMWDSCKCTNSGIETLEAKHKKVVVKDLRKIWKENGPRRVWVKGTYNESNTLLVDDSPYKALLNPKHTGIFPASYSYMNRLEDKFLAPKGELQTYLEGLAAADDVRTYVEQHPFGQGAIDEQSPHWAFYSSIIERLNDKKYMASLAKKNQKKCSRCHPY